MSWPKIIILKCCLLLLYTMTMNHFSNGLWHVTSEFYTTTSDDQLSGWTGKSSKSESEVLVTQSCPTLCNTLDCSPPGSSVHGILQARILEWVSIPFSKGSSHPKDQTQVSCIAGRFLTFWVTSGATRSSKALPKAKPGPKKGHGHCLVVCCPSNPL